MASDKSRRHQGAHAKRGYTCTGCGKVVHGNGARWAHKDMHERRGESVRMRQFRPGDHDSRPDSRPI